LQVFVKIWKSMFSSLLTIQILWGKCLFELQGLWLQCTVCLNTHSYTRRSCVPITV
jgi:hypothetical protein